MDTLTGWSPKQIIGLVAVIGAFASIMVVTIAVVWYLARRESLLANQKNDYLERGFSVEQIDQLLRSPGPSASESAVANEMTVEANLASLLVQYEVPAATMERVLKMFQETPTASKQPIHDAIEEMLESDVRDEQLIAAVGLLCHSRPANQSRAVGLT